MAPSVQNLLTSSAPFYVSLHDIGKVSFGFQVKYFLERLQRLVPKSLESKSYKNTTYKTDHASIGAQALDVIFDECLTLDNPVVASIAAHHGYAVENISIFVPPGDPWQLSRATLVLALASYFEQDTKALEDRLSRGDVNSTLLMGLTCVSDWIASDEAFFAPEAQPIPAAEMPSKVSSVLSECGFVQPILKKSLSFQDIFGFPPNETQVNFFSCVNAAGVYVLEAPMGLGKTEAALYAAYRLLATGVNTGLYFALPTRLTSDRIHERVERFLNAICETSQGVKLAHGQAWLKAFEHGREGSSNERKVPPWFNPSKRSLLYPFSVGTIDQALMGVVNVKHAFIRSFGLAGKVVVLDEVHSYDSYTGTLLDGLVRQLRDLGCTVLILSATLTASRRQALLDCAIGNDAYPLVTGIPSCGVRGHDSAPIVKVNSEPIPSREVFLEWCSVAQDSPIPKAIEQARRGCNVLCIANTVAQAQEWFKACESEKTEADTFPTGLLHSNFLGFKRDEIEADWMRKLGKGDTDRPRGSILIATQIVEQSVDIDADYLLSELAPIDMLLQRCGRLWRHERGTRPIDRPILTVICKDSLPSLDVVAPDSKLAEYFGKGVFVYAPYVLLRTYETLQGRTSLSIPADIRQLMEAVYRPLEDPSALHDRLLEKLKETKAKLKSLANSAQVTSLPTRHDDDEQARTRYNDRAYTNLLVVLSREINAKNELELELLNGQTVVLSRFSRNFETMRILYKNLVSVPVLGSGYAERTSDEDYLMQHFHRGEIPCLCILDEATQGIKFLNSDKETDFGYSPKYGVYRSRLASKVSETSETLNRTDDEDFYFSEEEDW